MGYCQVKFGGCQRCCTGEAACIVNFQNKADSEGFVSLTPNFPGKVVPVQLPSRICMLR